MSDLPRLLLCCFDVVPAPTAISRRMTEYVKGLSDRFQVVALTVKTPDHTHIERYHGARLLRVPVGSGDLAARVQAFDRAVRRQLDSEEYVMVHAFDPFGGYALCERRSEFGHKVVYDACALPSVDLPFLYDEVEANRRFIARVRRQELFCLMNADAVIVANDLTREFVSGIGVSREQVQVLPSPVDLTPYTPAVMGVPDATPMKLIHLGNLSNANDFSTLLEAQQLALQSADLGLTVVGPRHPAHQARLEEQIGALKLKGKVEFQDPVGHDDVHKVLATSDVGLLTLSDVERNSRVGSPLSRIAEYLAAGRPIIAADVGAARASLPDEGVVFYKPGDKVSLADAIASLATTPSLRVKLGAAARAAVLAHDGAKVRADLVAMYVALTGTGVRAVGDAEAANPDEVTQLGRAAGPTEDTGKKKQSLNVTIESKPGPELSTADTSPEAVAGAERPAVMGVPLREEELPIVMGQEAQDIAEFARLTTEPNARRMTEPPVVMGTPLASPPSENPRSVAAAEPGSPPLSEGELPDTGAHLSLVPKEAAEPARVTRAATKPVPPRPSEPPTPEPTTHAAPPPAPPPPSPRPPPFVPVPAAMPPSLATAATRPTRTAIEPMSEVDPAGPPPNVSESSAVRAAPAAQKVDPNEVSASARPTRTELKPPPAEAPAAPEPAPPDTTVPYGKPLEQPLAHPIAGSAPIFVPPLEMPTFTPSPVPALPPRAVPPPLKLSSPSGVRPTSPPPGATMAPVAVPEFLPRISGPPPLARTTSGSFAVVKPAPSAPLSSPAPAAAPAEQSSGLFPEPPRVPTRPLEVPHSSPSPVPELVAEDEIEEVTDEELEELADEELVEVPSLASASTTSDDAPEMAVEDAAELQAVDAEASPPDSAIDPWLAMAVHGYCPPESGLFNRHTPPTTMPGRDT